MAVQSEGHPMTAFGGHYLTETAFAVTTQC